MSRNNNVVNVVKEKITSVAGMQLTEKRLKEEFLQICEYLNVNDVTKWFEEMLDDIYENLSLAPELANLDKETCDSFTKAIRKNILKVEKNRFFIYILSLAKVFEIEIKEEDEECKKRIGNKYKYLDTKEYRTIRRAFEREILNSQNKDSLAIAFLLLLSEDTNYEEFISKFITYFYTDCALEKEITKTQAAVEEILEEEVKVAEKETEEVTEDNDEEVDDSILEEDSEEAEMSDEEFDSQAEVDESTAVGKFMAAVSRANARLAEKNKNNND